MPLEERGDEMIKIQCQDEVKALRVYTRLTNHNVGCFRAGDTVFARFPRNGLNKLLAGMRKGILFSSVGSDAKSTEVGRG